MSEFQFNVIKSEGFMNRQVAYEDSKKVIFGAPMDYTISFRPGARFAPNKIRQMSENLEDYSPYFKKNIFDIAFSDIGDVRLPMGNAENSLKEIFKVASRILEDGKIPICLGGEHLVSLPLIEAASKKHGEIYVLHFDAHADLRDEYEGEALSHSTVIKKAIEFVKPSHIFSFGIRSGTCEEFEYAEKNINFYPFQVLENVLRVMDKIKGKKVYITVDLDVFDPSVFPGTGTPEAGGIGFNEFIEVLKLLSYNHIEVIGFDLVELSPPYDPSEISGALASKLLREMIICL